MVNNKQVQSFGSSILSWFQDIMQQIKEFFVPKTQMMKKARTKQGMNILAFTLSTVAFIYFEERIMKLISLESQEISKASRF
mmetsp:Transcript_57022/g.65307  ORF Transcript_57022/g.65307 Transcript_57022/m.65307 type:complete len:82 (+) Transcript_57022:58-303(+)